MSDFVATTFIDIIPVKEVKLLDSTTLEVRANDVSNVKRVVVNSVDCSEFMVVSKNKLYATIPPKVQKEPLRSITLVGDSNEVSMVSFTATSTRKMNNSLYILQKYLRLLFMRKGSSVFAPDEGVNITELVGTTSGSIDTELVQKIKSAEQQLKQKQIPEMDDSMLLSMVKINTISYSVSTLTAFISLTLYMLDGSTVSADLNMIG